MKRYLVGRSPEANIIIFDPDKRVSREHAWVSEINNHTLFIRDIDSTNGTWLNGHQLDPHRDYQVTTSDDIRFGKSYQFFLGRYLKDLVEDNFCEPQSISPEITINYGTNKFLTHSPDRVTLGEITDFSDKGFHLIGRSKHCDIVLNSKNVSRNHLKIRSLGGSIIEIIDLGSTNSTFVDGQQLTPYKSEKFLNGAEVTLGTSRQLDYWEFLKLPKPQNDQPIDTDYAVAFAELKYVWKERMERKLQIKKLKNDVPIPLPPESLLIAGLSSLGVIIPELLIPGIGLAVSLSGYTFKLWTQLQKKKKLSDNMNFEEIIFPETYVCPACKKFFGDVPWIEIQKCKACNLRFR